VSELLYSDVEEEVRASVRSLLGQRSAVSQVLARIENGVPYDQTLWRTLATEMGLSGMAVPERFGGGGASLRESAVVLEELGRSLAPVPFLTSAVIATSALLACPDGRSASFRAEDQTDEYANDRADLLAKLAAGELVAVLALPWTTGPGAAVTPTVAVAGGSLSGQIRNVADGLAADVLLVPTADGLYAVDATAEGVTRTAVVSMDLTRPVTDVTLSGAAGRRVSAAAGAVVATALTTGAALLASEQLGLMEWCLDTTVEYAKTRHQFGRPIGSFQGLKHRLADLWVDIAQARAAARYAANCAATGDPDLPIAASVAQAWCSPLAVRVAEECVQMHGGIGFTWEHPAHLFLKRAKTDSVALGNADRHRSVLGGLVDLRA
jgi:alkylation response protein AidB-like acyl-CoA dehydrogenase